MPDSKPVNIFIAYAHADEAFLRPLRKHLDLLEDDDVDIWYDGEILPGEEWDLSIKTRLKAADIILLLVSIDFLTSDYVKGTELPTALSRHAAGECVVVPAIVRNCLWQKKLGNLQALPKDAFPVENWSSRDSAYHNVVEGLDKVIEEIKKQRTAAGQVKVAELEKPVQAQHHADRFFQNDKKSDPFADLMVFVQGGSFDMGSTERECEVPIHRVTVPDFYICKYPVTQKQWKQIMNRNDNPTAFLGNHDRPVEFLSWEGAQEFIQKLNEQTGQHYRLPSESEWEYAARGGNKSQGFKYAGSDDMDKVGWCNENASDVTQPVGQKEPNELGLFDMSGNVWEYCEDVWHEDYQGAPINGSAWKTGGDERQRVVRGGSYRSNSDAGRTTLRVNVSLGNNTERGFRLAHDYPM